MRFETDASGYFFVYEETRVISLPTKPALHGKDLGEAKDKNGVLFVKGLMEKAGSGGGFVSYVFDKPGKGIQPKLGYAEMIPGTRFWIGTGVYMDNVCVIKKQISHTIQTANTKNILWMAGISAAAFLLILMPVILGITRTISGSMTDAINGLKEIAEGDGDLTTRLEINSKDEMGELAGWINIFIENLQNIIRELAGNAVHLNNASGELSDISLNLSRSADETTEKSNTVAAAAEEMSVNMTAISLSGEEVSENVNLLALAAEEISATVCEIAANSEKAHGITGDAVLKAEKATLKVETLRAALRGPCRGPNFKKFDKHKALRARTLGLL